jgi:nucleoside-diphosphate-sugar epimerase
MKDPVEDFERQTLPLVNVLWAAARMQSPPRFLLVSSAAVYGNPDVLPTPENNSLRPISPYGHHKVIQELLVDEYRQVYGLPVAKARVFSTFGPGLRHLAIWEITKRAMANDYSLRGLGDESRDYLHLVDVASALVCIANGAPFAGEAINVASGVETTVRSVAQMIFECLGYSGFAEFDGQDLTGSPRRWCADTSLLRSLGFEQRVNVRHGIRETIQWIENNA